jgi:hypothetical protein
VVEHERALESLFMVGSRSRAAAGLADGCDGEDERSAAKLEAGAVAEKLTVPAG